MAKYSFRTKDGKYPVSGRGKVEWYSDKQRVIELAIACGAHEIVEFDDSGSIVDVLQIDNTKETGE